MKMQIQEAARMMLSSPRLEPYLAASHGDIERAIELYLWATETAGVLHAQISFVEIAVRNALDPVLSAWNDEQGNEYGPEWTSESNAAQPLYGVMRTALTQARRHARNEALRRPTLHPRKDVVPTHDDVLVQLTFGAWTTLIYGTPGDFARQQTIWEEATHKAFPYEAGDEQARRRVGQQLDDIRLLRNRVAHHDNLLKANLNRHLNWSLSLLAKINPDYPDLAMARSALRRLIRDDPRRSW